MGAQYIRQSFGNKDIPNKQKILKDKVIGDFTDIIMVEFDISTVVSNNFTITSDEKVRSQTTSIRPPALSICHAYGQPLPIMTNLGRQTHVDRGAPPHT